MKRGSELATKRLIYELRVQKDLSIKDLTSVLNIPLEDYIEFEMGRADLNQDNSQKIEGFFKYPIDDLKLPTPEANQPIIWALAT